jgi:hypothetical protein
MNIAELFQKGSRMVTANPTTLLTGMGVAGVVTTAYLTGKASFRAAQLIEDAEDEKQAKIGDSLTNKEKVAAVWPLYVPAISVGCTTITAIVMANHSASKKIAALTIASGISDRALTEYKAKVVEKLGERKETAIRDEIAQERVNKIPPTTKEVIIAGTGDVLCFDLLTGRYFQSSVEKVRQAEIKINYDIINHMYASLSSFYDEIGLPPTPYSDTVGWNGSERFEVLFSTVLSTDNRPCLAIDFSYPPFVEYTNLY